MADTVRTWHVGTDAKVWRTVTVEAETIEDAMSKAVADSQEWGEDAERDGQVSFSTWRAGEVA